MNNSVSEVANMSKAVFQVNIDIVNSSEHFVGEPLYLAGSFNNWRSEHICIGVIPPKGERCSFVLSDVPAGELELKLSRGDFGRLACQAGGRLGAPHSVHVDVDTSVQMSIESWRELFPDSTASAQVHILDEEFYFPSLAVARRVWIYLPKEYQTSGGHYPVIYMHDGQHLFDEATSVGRAGPIEWMVDETVDASQIPSIIVAIDHAQSYQQREKEMMVSGQDAKGWQYLKDIVEVLKPHVDSCYRTLAGEQTTAIVGSSLGGLLSLYGALEYPEVFGVAGILSPSIWMDSEQLYQYTSGVHASKTSTRGKQEIYLYTGQLERRKQQGFDGLDMAAELTHYHGWLSRHFKGKLHLDIDFHGKHGALYWQQAFRNFYTYWQRKIKTTQKYNYEIKQVNTK